MMFSQLKKWWHESMKTCEPPDEPRSSLQRWTCPQCGRKWHVEWSEDITDLAGWTVDAGSYVWVPNR